MYFRLFESNGY